MLALTLAWSVLAFGGYPPLAFLGSLVLTLAVFGVHVFAASRTGDGALPVPWFVWASLPFLGWAAASAAWFSDAAWIGWIDWLRWMQGVVLFWLTGVSLRARGPRRLVLITLGIVAVIVVFGACGQLYSERPPLWAENRDLNQDASRATGPFFSPNSLAGFLVLLIPAAIAVAVRTGISSVIRVAAGWLAGVLVLGLVLAVSRGGWIALALAGAAWVVVSARPEAGRRWWRAGIVLLGLIGLGLVLLWGSPETQRRFAQMVVERGEVTRPVMWQAAWQILVAHPLIGSGGGSYNFAFEAVRPEGFTKDPIWAHCDYLNVLSDYGIVGAGLACFAALAWVRVLASAKSAPTAGRQRVSDWSDSTALRSGLRVGLLALAVHAAVDFHFRIPGLLVTAAVLAGLARRRDDEVGVTGGWRVPRAGALALTAVVAALLIFQFGPLLRGEAARRGARRLIDGLWGVEITAPRYRVDLLAAERALRAATELHAGNAQAWSDLAYALALRSHLEPARGITLGREAEVAADHALRLGPGLWEPWIRRSVARDLQGRWFEAGDDSATALARAPANAEVWYYHAYHLSHRRNERFIALAAAEFCLRLDPQNRGAQALRARLSSGDRGPR